MPLEKLPPPATRSVGRRYLVVGGVWMVAGTLCATASPALAIAFAVVGGFGAAYGYFTIRRVRAQQMLWVAMNEIARGRFDRAGEWLDAAEAKSRSVRGLATLERAEMSVACDDFDDALVRLDQILASVPRSGHRHVRAAALAERAYVRATMGDAPGAEADARAALEDDHTDAGGVARARLAQALLKRGDSRALGEHLRAHGELILQFSTPRERAALRELRRVSTEPGSAYRVPGDRVTAEAPNLDRTDAALPARAPTTERAARGGASRVFRLQVALVVVVTVFGVAQVVAPVDPYDVRMGLRLLVFFLVIFSSWVLLVVLERRRSGKKPSPLLGMKRRFETEHSPETRTVLERMAQDRHAPNAAGFAGLILAGDDERRGDSESALRRSDEALTQLHALRRTAASYDLLVPALHACKARSLAALGSEKPALSELALLERDHPAFPWLESTRSSVHLMLAVQRGDFALAARIARSRDHEPSVALGEDYLGDLARLEAGESLTGAHQRQLRAEINAHPELQRWLERVGQEPLARLYAATHDST